MYLRDKKSTGATGRASAQMRTFEEDDRSEPGFEARERGGCSDDAASNDEHVWAPVQSRRYAVPEDSNLNVCQLVRPKRTSVHRVVHAIVGHRRSDGAVGR
jgi:hypothetical protein